MIMLDTDVLIDVSRRSEPSLRYIRKLSARGEPLATTSVNAAEFLRGGHAGPDLLAARVRILEAFSEVPFGPRAARRFAELMHTLDKAGGPIPTTDGLIAAAVLEAGGRLLTRNVRDFGRVPGLSVVVPE